MNYKPFTISVLTGGGKSYLSNLLSTSYRRQWLWLLLPVLCLVGCSKPTKTICGVPVQGTTWELAAAIADHGDGTFHPVCVQDRIFQDKTFIEGVINPCTDYEEDRIIVCNLDANGQVVNAYMVIDLSEE